MKPGHSVAVVVAAEAGAAVADAAAAGCLAVAVVVVCPGAVADHPCLAAVAQVCRAAAVAVRFLAVALRFRVDLAVLAEVHPRRVAARVCGVIPVRLGAGQSEGANLRRAAVAAALASDLRLAERRRFHAVIFLAVGWAVHPRSDHRTWDAVHLVATGNFRRARAELRPTLPSETLVAVQSVGSVQMPLVVAASIARLHHAAEILVVARS